MQAFSVEVSLTKILRRICATLRGCADTANLALEGEGPGSHLATLQILKTQLGFQLRELRSLGSEAKGIREEMLLSKINLEVHDEFPGGHMNVVSACLERAHVKHVEAFVATLDSLSIFTGAVFEKVAVLETKLRAGEELGPHEHMFLGDLWRHALYIENRLT